MATGKVTITAIGKLNGWLWDTTCVGFGARRQTNGLFYYVRYRHNGQQTVKSIGRHGSPWTPDTARARARELLGVVAGGNDPFAPALAVGGDTFGVVVDRYLERKRGALKPKSFAEATRYLRTLSASLAKVGLAQIDRRNIAVLLGQIEDASGAVTRNRARSALSAFFSWAITEGLVDTNPVMGTAKANENGSRERVLTRDELRKLWRSLDDGPFDDIVRLLLLTGSRRNEIGKLQWGEIDLGQGMIVLPAGRTKNGRQHELPLSRQALAIVERQPRRNSTAFVFSDNGNQDWDRSKARLDGKMGIAPWRLHDLRRTCSTMLGELGVLPHVIEQALNHVSGAKAGVAGIYNKSKMIDAVRDGLQRWADHIDQITK
jgi:integrase